MSRANKRKGDPESLAQPDKKSKPMLCCVCEKEPEKNNPFLRCQVCSSPQHLQCTFMSVEYYNNNIVKRKKPWTCLDCNSTAISDNTEKIKQIDNKTKELKQQIGQISEIQTTQDEKIKSIETKIAAASCSSSSTPDFKLIKKAAIEFESQKLKSNLLLAGLPFVENEELKKTFRNIAHKLGVAITENSIIKAIRLSKRSVNKNHPPPVLIILKKPETRKDILDMYYDRLKTKNFLTSSEFGIKPDSRLYINIHIPKLMNELHQTVIKMKRNKEIDSFVVKPTEIKIKYNNKWFATSTLEDLHKIMSTAVSMEQQ